MKPILEIQNISKKYRIRGQESPYLTLRDSIMSFGKKSLKISKDEFWALKDINFNVYPGESIGIIGRNGAGKSTLLKILSRITPPTQGRIISRGRVASLLEVGTGFHAELTGRENIFLNGSILGLRKEEINKKFDEIVDFSGVEKFLDTPLKHYSSGMQLRLAFAVAAHLEPEILVIDEVLSVGDAAFQKKSLGKMEEVTKQGRTVLFVSHNMAAVQNLCDRGVLLHNGKLLLKNDIKNVITEYTSKLFTDNTVNLNKIKRPYDWGKSLRIISCEILNNKGEQTKTLFYSEPLSVKFKFTAIDKDYNNIDAITSIETYLGTTILGVSSKNDMLHINCYKDEIYEITTSFENIVLTPGNYSIKLALKVNGILKDLIRQELFFNVQEVPFDNNKKYSGLNGFINTKNNWDIKNVT